MKNYKELLEDLKDPKLSERIKELYEQAIKNSIHRSAFNFKSNPTTIKEVINSFDWYLTKEDGLHWNRIHYNIDHYIKNHIVLLAQLKDKDLADKIEFNYLRAVVNKDYRNSSKSFTETPCSLNEIINSFTWDKTIEGVTYWVKIYRNIEDYMKTNKTDESNEYVSILKSDYDKMKEILSKNEIREEKFKVWKPDYGKEYYILLSNGEVLKEAWCSSSVHNDRYSLGNCFKTKQDCEFYRDKTKVLVSMERRMLELNGGKDPYTGKSDNYTLIYYNAKINVTSVYTVKSTYRFFKCDNAALFLEEFKDSIIKYNIEL